MRRGFIITVVCVVLLVWMMADAEGMAGVFFAVGDGVVTLVKTLWARVNE